jgi:hypothetical protein
VVLILRSIFLKGVGFDVLWLNMLIMAGFAFLMLSVSIFRFRKSLEIMNGTYKSLLFKEAPVRTGCDGESFRDAKSFGLQRAGGCVCHYY